ncbi:hypothetical protein BHE74_00037609 [Ensete ventricosum]|nr:hypothetical protein GW17_00049094 [Ensete ventricosum]RWW55768.1 hypothetical protein BHE74_00037609 [Ensete ventricosum]RZS19486.1 hypothetical protein BHM03_00051900 [Ensete ventricosum]
MTLKAIKKIDKIRVDREVKHHKMRLVSAAEAASDFCWQMKGKKAFEQQAAIKELESSIDLVKAPAALQQDSQFTLAKIKVEVSRSQPEGERMEE